MTSRARDLTEARALVAEALTADEREAYVALLQGTWQGIGHDVLESCPGFDEGDAEGVREIVLENVQPLGPRIRDRALVAEFNGLPWEVRIVLAEAAFPG